MLTKYDRFVKFLLTKLPEKHFSAAFSSGRQLPFSPQTTEFLTII